MTWVMGHLLHKQIEWKGTGNKVQVHTQNNIT